MEINPRSEGASNQKTPEGILRSTAARFEKLTSQSDESIFKKRDPNEHRELLRKRAQLIVDLPSKIQMCIKKGESFPESKINDINTMAQFASEALKDEGAYLLGTLLLSHDPREGDSNFLETLIDDIYPKSKV